MRKNILKIIFATILASVLPVTALAQADKTNTGTIAAPSVVVFPSPLFGSFLEGSVFEVPIFLDTQGASVKGVELRISFDKDKLVILQQSNGISMIGEWTEPPRYNNQNGTASYVGLIPRGITTNSGLIGNITFKTLSPGKATLIINDDSRILLNDDLETVAKMESLKGEYLIIQKAPEGVLVFSETHPIQSKWYNNNSPTISWNRDPNSEGFSFVLDNKPNTVPDNDIDTKDTAISFAKKKDGLWYFHIKEKKSGVWSATGNFLVRIDTVPPSAFLPEVNFLTAATVLAGRTMVSFFTTDNLSGIDHYEAGIIDKTEPPTESPVFIQTESPFFAPLAQGGKLSIVVRAVDKAGNMRDSVVNLNIPKFFEKFAQNYLAYILWTFVIFSCLFFVFICYFFGRHILKHLRRTIKAIKREEQMEQVSEDAENSDENLYKAIVMREDALKKEQETKLVEK